ncbi:LOW QUALITY PROTEIN: uncharacterized protein [Eucyclogobius newberryi]|uniref:LOW QUALITY PROTEIN: uncharacterized protein n=1 Tax=Eucyclogobius newberryi TaxID=166745 RepID=UPI003B5A749F
MGTGSGTGGTGGTGMGTAASHPLLLLLFLHPCLQLGRACGPGTEKDVSTDPLMLCRACGAEVANGSDVGFVPSRLALSSRNDTLPGGRRVAVPNVQLFENPHGRRFEVIAFRRAGVALHWPADERASWFPGFAWTVATCPRCKAHLGWGFQPDHWPHTVTASHFEDSPSTFLGLIARALVTEEFASSLLVTPKSFVS